MNVPAASNAVSHAAAGGPFRRVLVAWDGSADSVVALRTAAAIVADSTSTGHVVAMSILPAARHPEAARDQSRSDQARRIEAIFETTRASIGRTLTVRIDLHTAEGRHVAGSVCDYAAEHGFDLLIVGRHGDGGLMHPKLGHIAEAAARSCNIPVLLISAS